MSSPAGAGKSAWPHGPFPEKWSFASVEKRLSGAWDERAASWDALVASGARRIEPIDDLYVRAFEGGSEEAIGSLDRCTVWGWAAAPGAKVALPCTDVFDALVAVGVAGPHYGIGNRTIVRFLVQARAMAAFRVIAASEDRLDLEMHARNAETAQLLAERLPHICPAIDRDGLRDGLLARTTLQLGWPPR